MKRLIPLMLVFPLALAACGGGTSTTETSESASAGAWNETDAYKEYCTPDPSIAPEVQAAVDAVEIPEGGHVQNARYRDSTDQPGMVEVSFDVCAPLAGDELRKVAEELAIQVRGADFGSQVSTMGVHALPEDTTPESILRDTDFQSHVHDGGAAFENGAYRAAWEAKN
ncbi:hypothetical protein ACEE90_03635 [Corynebacterium phoceense]